MGALIPVVPRPATNWRYLVRMMFLCMAIQLVCLLACLRYLLACFPFLAWFFLGVGSCFCTWVFVRCCFSSAVVLANLFFLAGMLLYLLVCVSGPGGAWLGTLFISFHTGS